MHLRGTCRVTKFCPLVAALLFPTAIEILHYVFSEFCFAGCSLTPSIDLVVAEFIKSISLEEVFLFQAEHLCVFFYVANVFQAFDLYFQT